MILTSIAAALLVPLLPAQSPSEARSQDKAQARAQANKAKKKVKKQDGLTEKQKQAIIRRKILEHRRQSRTVKRNVKVRVRLRNGESLIGVVKEGRFVEKVRGLEFVPADIRTKGAGIRLWYYDNTDGYIFLPYTMIRTYKILKELTGVEIKAIRDRILERRRKASELAKKRLMELKRREQELLKNKNASKKLDKLAKNLKEEEKKRKEEERLLALIQEFPPDKGWGPKKIEEIRIRKVAIGAFPDAKSKRFVEVFEDWVKGYNLWKALKEKESKKVKNGKVEPVQGNSGSSSGKKN
ncbi:MAG TPA: hypothetical protein ENK02_11830 [Planctomycetes bacterium]|nr:hypothetical protein [Planctomycetota bacterium]